MLNPHAQKREQKCLQCNHSKKFSLDHLKMETNRNDFTSPLSRPSFTSFKRPSTLPLGPSQIGNQQFHQNSVNGIPASKKLRRCESMKSESESIPLSKSMSMSTLDSPQLAKPLFQLSLNSESEASIKKACLLADEPNLTGDRSRKLILPTVPGKFL